MKNHCIVFVLICTLMISTSARAEILGEIYRTNSSGSGTRSVLESLHFILYVQEWPLPLEGEWDLFGPFNEEDLGQTRIISSESPGFNSFVDFLTNGKDDWLYQKIHGSHMGSLESRGIDKFVESYEPDFYGYEITEITLTVNGSIETPGRNPNDDGNWTDYSWETTYRFYGERVPEPTTLLLLAVGGMIVRKIKR